LQLQCLESAGHLESTPVENARWRRTLNRVYPAKPKVGVRAKAPCELLHLDVTIICLLDGTRAYLPAVIDNYSLRILSEAVVQPKNCPEHTIMVADSGSQNVNRAVNDLSDDEELTRGLAQVEVTFSNSMIEAFWRSLKHSWLYLHTPDGLAALRHLIEFYVKADNEVMPHSAFQGQTTDEVLFGIGDEVPSGLPKHASRLARNE
jgi:putative transposase